MGQASQLVERDKRSKSPGNRLPSVKGVTIEPFSPAMRKLEGKQTATKNRIAQFRYLKKVQKPSMFSSSDESPDFVVKNR